MNELIQKLGWERNRIDVTINEIGNIKALLAATAQGQLLASLERLLETQRMNAGDLATEIRIEALAAYAADGNKKPHAAVVVKEFTVLDYDERLALAYCRENIPEALKLDAKKFEKVASITKPKFVTERTEARAQIATDLSQYVDVGAYDDGPMSGGNLSDASDVAQDEAEVTDAAED